MSTDLLKFTRNRPALAKTAAAGLIGATLPLVALGAGYVLAATPLSGLLCSSGGLECFAPIVLSAAAVAMVVAWGALALIRVRPAWLVVLIGTVLSFLVGWTITQVVPSPGDWFLFPLTATCFAVAALATMRLIDSTRRGGAGIE